LSVPVLSWLFIALGKGCSWETSPQRHRPALPQHASRRAAASARLTRQRSRKPLFRMASKQTPRPNPQSQSFSQSYGSILPTSLIYIVLSTRGCSPWRPDAVMSTTRGVNRSRPWIFKGRRERTRTPQKLRCFASHGTLSLTKSIPGSVMITAVKKKRELFPGLAQASPSLLVLPHSIHVLVQEY